MKRFVDLPARTTLVTAPVVPARTSPATSRACPSALMTARVLRPSGIGAPAW
jgi:hypothetical protein